MWIQRITANLTLPAKPVLLSKYCPAQSLTHSSYRRATSVHTLPKPSSTSCLQPSPCTQWSSWRTGQQWPQSQGSTSDPGHWVPMKPCPHLIHHWPLSGHRKQMRSSYHMMRERCCQMLEDEDVFKLFTVTKPEEIFLILVWSIDAGCNICQISFASSYFLYICINLYLAYITKMRPEQAQLI